ncbi:MAG: pterin-4-alpha-carbinolamine dehydratase [Chromatiales bacterium 21-64-14]|nr:MAG: pterin-4-alpha-carbinolamine dehydratase [Chromatiales bacterium 21-64-14]HQU17013.1 4a-hydroxytetrahydrobiopterin dehydratase [Gammaproteobacteria bacterium]
MHEHWQERDRPRRLERRYEFSDYAALRDFLDRAAALSEREGFYPDMGFARDYVNVTIHAEEGAKDVSSAQRRFAEELDGLLALDPVN